MTSASSERPAWTVPAACGLVALVVSLAAGLVVMQPKDMRPSALVRMTVQDPIATKAIEADSDFVLYASDHYDGIYFWAIAQDPVLTNEEHRLIDLPGARYGHPMFSWVALLLSFGKASTVPLGMFLLNLISMGVAGGSASLIARRMGLSPWAGLVVALNPGLIYAVTVSTSEAFGTMVLLLSILAWMDKKWALAGICMVVLCLAKEPYVLVPIALGSWEVVARRRYGGSAIRPPLTPLLWGPIALLLWQLYLRSQLGYWAFTDPLEVFAFPLRGWLETMRMAVDAGDAGDFAFSQIGAATIPIDLAVFVALTVGVVVARKVRGPVDLMYLGFAALHYCLTWRNLLYAKDLIRQFSTVFVLLPVVLSAARWPGIQELRRTPNP